MKIPQSLSHVLLTVVLAASALLSPVSEASVVIAGTRVVYNANDSEVTLKVSNKGSSPTLTQVWLDKGNPKEDPSKLDLPFIMTPALARIDPQKSQTIRISYTGEPLPQDRETLFWFNLLEVPPEPANAQANNYVQLAFRSRLKFFFRPAGLSGSADDAPDKLVWRLVNQGGKAALQVKNPTEYHVTIISAQVGSGENAPKFDEGDMVTPGGEITLPLNASPAAGGKVSFKTLNDFGGSVAHEAAFQ